MRPYRAPDADGGLLTLPAVADYGSLLEANARLWQSPIAFAGVSLSDLRTQAAEEVLALAVQYHRHFGETVSPRRTKLLVGGHQPELFHAGVWAKNFALHQIAQQHNLTALNLIVDNDTIKAAELRWPTIGTHPTDVSLQAERFDHLEAEIPYEEYAVQDRGLFTSFAERFTERTRAWGYRPLLQDVWPAIVAMVERGCRVGNVFAAVRRQRERAWGVQNLELPVSRLAETTAFRLFTHHLLQHLPTFTTAYNGAIRAYREAHHLRSRNHPAPELESQGTWHEVPLWVWHREQPTRMKLYARRVEGGTELRADKTILMVWPDDPQHATIPDGWKIRPRALTLTLFARLCLAEAFVHGIGGGKYDEVTDDIIRRFWMVEPPHFGVVSATLRLPLPKFPATLDDKQRTLREQRDLRWNPQLWPETAAEQPALVQAKREQAQHKPNGRRERRQWFRQLQELTLKMRPTVAENLPVVEQRLQQIDAELTANTILRRRDYAWPLFPESMLRDYFARSFDIHESQHTAIARHEDHQAIGREGQRA